VKISEIFHSIQGEGKLMGVPCVFIRASGCNLRCVWCDTPYASWSPEGSDIGVDEIIRQVAVHSARHVVLTGGEPTIMPDFAPLCAALKDANHHITVETAATVFTPAKIDLASLSPKLANSTPHHRDGGRFAAMHEKQRLNIEVSQQWIDSAPDFQLKFVVASLRDMDEIDAVLAKLKRWSPSDVLLMPEGTDQPTLDSRAEWIAQTCKQTGFRFCPRLHIALYGNRRGT
jgi:7-carboxy-7-deazaguanine synthase